MSAPLCDSCGRRPAVRRLHLAPDVEGFAVCQPCDLLTLETERRPAVRYVQSDPTAPAVDGLAILLARRAVLDTIPRRTR